MSETAATGTSTSRVEAEPDGGSGRTAGPVEDSVHAGAEPDQEGSASGAPTVPDEPEAAAAEPEPEPEPEPPAAPPPEPPPSAGAPEPAEPESPPPAVTVRPPGAPHKVHPPGPPPPSPPPSSPSLFGPPVDSGGDVSGGGGAPAGQGGGSPPVKRPPGMAPPPETPEAAAEREAQQDHAATMPAAVGVPSSPVLSGPPRFTDTSASGSFPVVTANSPVSAPPRATGRAATSGVTMRPITTPAAPPGGPAVGAARVTESVRPPRSSSSTPRGPRRARLAVKRIDPWSVMKFSFAVSLVLFVVVIVAASVLYLALDSMGVFTSINETVADLVESGGGEGSTFRITARGVIGTAAVIGALNVLLFTSLATLGAFIYNVCADLVGGMEVTLAERD